MADKLICIVYLKRCYKITPSVDYNRWLKCLDTVLFERTNKISIIPINKKTLLQNFGDQFHQQLNLPFLPGYLCFFVSPIYPPLFPEKKASQKNAQNQTRLLSTMTNLCGTRECPVSDFYTHTHINGQLGREKMAPFKISWLSFNVAKINH